MKFLYLLFTLFSIYLFSCSLENKKPEFKRVENVKVNEFTAQNVEIHADAIVYNPNPVSIYLQKTEIDVFANDIKVSHISQIENTEIKKKAEFSIPLKADFKLTDLLKDNASILDVINNSLKAFTDKKIDLNYKGTATFKVVGVEFDVPIEYSDVVELK